MKNNLKFFLKNVNMHNILSIDVGLLNLAFCSVSIDTDDDHPISINLWEIINTLGTDLQICSGKLKSGNNCTKSAGYICQDVHYCKSHIPKTTPFKKIKIKQCKSFTLQEIAVNIVSCINDLYKRHTDLFLSLNKVLIELQPRVNNKMKFVSHIIFAKLAELLLDNPNCTIRFVAAKNKLKNFPGPEFVCDVKSKYSQRKRASVYYCKWYLENCFTEEDKTKWKTFLESNRKEDDLADTFNMCIQEYKLKVKK